MKSSANLLTLSIIGKPLAVKTLTSRQDKEALLLTLRPANESYPLQIQYETETGFASASRPNMRTRLCEETEGASQHSQVLNTGTTGFSSLGISDIRIPKGQYHLGWCLTVGVLRLMKLCYRTVAVMLAASSTAVAGFP